MQPSFAVEKTMGRLAKWLRLMGFDTLLETDYPKGMFARHIDPGRVFLTRTQRALKTDTASTPVFIQANDPMDQMAEVIHRIALRREDLRPFSRCLQCNEPIMAVAKEEIARAVPDYILETQEHFSRCPKCKRVYWQGSHTTKSLERIELLFQRA
jgi:uncharacterized protein with PIN domain